MSTTDKDLIITKRWIVKYPREFILALIFLSLPFELYPKLEVAGYTVRISQILALVLIIACIPLLQKHYRELIKMPWVFLSLFVANSLVSSVFALNSSRAFVITAIYSYVFLLSYCVSKVFNLKNSEVYAKIIFSISLFVVAFCLWQFWADSYGVPQTYTLLLTPYIKSIFGFARVQGFSLEPLYLANYLLIPLGLSLGYYFFTARKDYLLLVGIFFGTILLTIARGALLAAIAMLVLQGIILVWQKKARFLPWLMLVVGVSVLVVFGMIRWSGEVAKEDLTNTIVPEDSRPNLPDQSVSGEGNTERAIYQVTGASSDKSVGDRLSTTKDALQLGADNAVLGVGPGNFGATINNKNPSRYPDARQIVNNEPAEIFAETGIFGLLLVIIFAGWIVVKMMGYRFVHFEMTQNIWFLATSLMLVGFAVQWQTFSTLYITHIWVMIGVFIGVAHGAKFRSARPSSPAGRLRSKPVPHLMRESGIQKRK